MPNVSGLGMQGQANFTFIGFPYDEKSSFRRGCALAPAKIRSQFFRRAIRELTPYQIRLNETARIRDAGDVFPEESDVQTLRKLANKVAEVMRNGSFPLVAGGDHSTTVGAVRGMTKVYNALHVVVFDAHPDLYDNFKGDPLSHACVNARLLELPAVRKITLVGVREFAEEERQRWQKESGVKIVFVDEARRGPVEIQSDLPVYLSVDLDVLDPVYAPGVSDWSYRGLAPSRLLEDFRLLRAHLVGMDVVEVNPRVDENDITAMLAAKFLAAVAAKVVSEARFQKV